MLVGADVKKLGASVLVKDKIVVNSTNFHTYRPIGSIDQIVARLQEWEVDEITVLNLSHSNNPLQDFDQLFSESLLSKINTPIAYGGGITTKSAAESIISAGCERVVLSGCNWTAEKSREISVNLGDQAVLIHVPLVQKGSEFSVHKTGTSFQEFLDFTPEDWGGELFIKDRDMDGATSRIEFFRSVSFFTQKLKSPILAGGGISSVVETKELLELPFLAGVMIGNWLNRDELIIPRIKQGIGRSVDLRNLLGYIKC